MLKGFRHVFSPERFSAAEGLLGATALVLVIWLLWPDGNPSGPEQRVAWQQQLNETPLQQSDEDDAHGAGQMAGTADLREETSIGNVRSAPERRALAKPSELADRYASRSTKGPVAIPVARGIRPEQIESVIEDTSTLSEAEIAVAPAVEEDVAPVVDQSPAAAGGLSAEERRRPDGLETARNNSVHVRQRPRDDAPSWLKNAVAASLIDDRPVIAVVIDDLGLNRVSTRALNDLPGPLTLAFLPYAGNIEAQTVAAKRAGHELMVHLPMEPLGSAWPGPDALITSLGRDEFVRRLESNLDRIKDYVGVNNHMGSRLTSDRGRMDLVMRELRERDVLFLDSRTSPQSVASEVASRNGVPNTTRDVFLDHVIDLQKIRSQMAKVERIARLTGSAVAIGHPHAATIEALADWLPKLSKRGFVLAPISAVVARRACDDGLLIAAETCGRYLSAEKPSIPAVIAGGG